MSSGRLDAFVPPPTVRSAGRCAAPSSPRDRDLGCRPGRAGGGLDGVDGAGKTVLARELAGLVGAHREVHRASVDGFHRPAAQRYARGRTAETFYRDQYDHAAVRTAWSVRSARASRGRARCTTSSARWCSTSSRSPVPARDAVLVVDGIFLHRPELADLWDLDVWLEVPFEVSVPRGNARFGDGGRARGRPGVRGERPLRRRAAALPRRGRPGRPGDVGARQHRPHGAGAHG